MALQDTLPADWGSYGAAEKINFFNTAGVTPSQLADAGVDQATINWMQTSGGYNVSDAPAPAATTAPAATSAPTFVEETGPAYVAPASTSTGALSQAQAPVSSTGALAATPAQEETINVPGALAKATPSAAYMAATGTGGIGLDKMNQNIRDFLATNPSPAQLQSAMTQWGVSQADIDRATASSQAAPVQEQLENNPLLAKPYNEFKGTLTGGTMTADKMQSLYGSVAPNFAKNVTNIANQILSQQAAGTDKYWYSGNTASNQNAAWDYAFRLAEKGVTDLSDLELKTGTQDLGIDEYGNPNTAQYSELVNKKTGQSLGYLGSGNQWDSSHNFDLDYKIGFTKDGIAIPYTSNQASEWADLREGLVKPALNMFATAYGLGPYMAAANAAYAASKGDWEKALTSALSASVPIAQTMGLDASTISNLQTAKQIANVLQALDNNNLLGAALGGADLAGISNVAGIDVKEISQAVKIANAVLNAEKNPIGLVNSLMPYGKSSTTTNEPPLSEEELAQRAENRWQKFLNNLPTEDTSDADARTQELLAEWAASEDPNAESGVSVNEFEDFLKSIGIETTTDFGSSLTNQEILDAIGYNDDQNLVITTPPVTTDLIDSIVGTLPPLDPSEVLVTVPPVTTPPVTIPEVVITTERPATTPPVTIPEVVITTDRPITTPPVTIPEVVITTDRPVTTPPVTIPEVVITTDRPITTPPVTIPEVVITTDRPVTTPPATIPEVVITTDRPVTTLPATTPPVTIPEVVITTDRPVTTPPVTIPEIVITTDRPTPPPETTPEIVITTDRPVTTIPVTTLPPTTPVVTTTATTKVTVAPTSATTGFSMPQAQAVAATFGLPQLANVFYYGKDFGSKKQKLKDGEVEEKEYKPLSVTKAGEVGEALEEAEIAQAKKTKENDVNGLIEQILGKSQDNVSLDDLLNIVKGA